MAELLLSPLLEFLFSRMTQAVLDYAKKFAGITDSELRMWESRLRMMEAVRIDAEEKQLTNLAVKRWLDELRDLSYDVEDILDEFATEAARHELKAKNRTKFCSLVANPFTKLGFNRDMAAKVKNVTERLDELFKMMNGFGLKVFDGPTTSAWRQISTTGSLPDCDVGREDERKQILESLQDDSISIVSVVGLGGIGKTRLVRSVYNDSDVVNNFPLRAWVCVSQGFDVMRISKAVLNQFTSSPCDSKESHQEKLQRKLAGKKFLVVLDDVWCDEDDKWEALRSRLGAGAPGSKIILTARDKRVARTMGSICYNKLERLSGDVCWSIFKKHADSCGDSRGIREKVVKKCDGLPLAARTLGGLLRSKNENEWEKILDDKRWELSNDGSDILPVLRLSYQHLPAHLKRCFAYCAIFPKDYEFEEMEVVLLWMAEGLIHEPQSNKEMEDLGREYFQDLSSISLFQRSNTDSSKFAMHDLVNDLAQKITGETSFRQEDDVTSNQISKDFRKVRHASYRGCLYEGKDRFEAFKKGQSLRTLLFIPPGLCIRNKVYDVLPELKKLWVLSLKGYEVDELPNSIGGLIHLRALDLTETRIISLPESTCSLLNLQTLILKNCCQLRKLPSKLKDLVELRYLDIRGAVQISEMPNGVGDLKCLRN